MNNDTFICHGPTCREPIRLVTVDGLKIPVSALPDPSGLIVVFGKDSGVRLTPDQMATLVNGSVYKEHECSDVVYLRLRRRDQRPQQKRYAGARR